MRKPGPSATGFVAGFLVGLAVAAGFEGRWLIVACQLALAALWLPAVAKHWFADDDARKEAA